MVKQGQFCCSCHNGETDYSLLFVAESNSPRRSIVPRLSRSSSKPSTPKRFSKSPSCASPLLLHVISRRSRSLGGSLISPLVSAENSLVVNNGSVTGM